MYEIHTPTLVVRAGTSSEKHSSFENLGLTVRSLPGWIMPVMGISSAHITPDDNEILGDMVEERDAPLVVRCLDALGLFVLVPFGGSPDLLYAQRQELLVEHRLSLAYVELLTLAHASGAHYLLTGGDLPKVPGLPSFEEQWR